jgi:hypothetical protein
MKEQRPTRTDDHDDESSSLRVRGVVTTAHLAEALAEGMEIFED